MPVTDILEVYIRSVYTSIYFRFTFVLKIEMPYVRWINKLLQRLPIFQNGNEADYSDDEVDSAEESDNIASEYEFH